jgi:hypothetical protein
MGGRPVGILLLFWAWEVLGGACGCAFQMKFPRLFLMTWAFVILNYIPVRDMPASRRDHLMEESRRLEAGRLPGPL